MIELAIRALFWGIRAPATETFNRMTCKPEAERKR